MRTRGARLHTLVGAYVMDAVSAADRASFERHLLTCEQCQVDVRGLREAAARLASAASVPPRPELREQTMQAAAADQAATSAGGRGGGQTAGGPPMDSELAAAHPWDAAARPSMAGQGRGQRGRDTGGDSDRLRPAHGLDAEQADRSSAARRAIAAILGARDATTLTAQVSTGGRATVVMSHRADALVFIASGLARLPASKAYELWLMGPGWGQSGRHAAPGRHGMTGPMVVDGLTRGDHLAMTVEPATGARRPTSAPVVMVGLGR